MNINFMEKFAANVREYPDKVILTDDATPRGATFSQIDLISGKIHAYLQKKGIGKEDFVLICLPRGIQPIISMIGVWKNGSAFVIVEDNYAPERIEFIKKDCGCKLVLNSEVWEEIQLEEPLEGFVPMDEKAAAFAVYTSGTTGNPKGVLHEYGNINRMAESVMMQSCEPLTVPDDRFALVAPLNFIASQLIIVYGFYFGIHLFVVAYSVVKNPLSIGMFIIKNKITGTFLTPSYIRTMKTKPPMLRFCIIGSEPANEVFLDGLTIHNFYLMSESGFAVTHFLIDKKYEFTPVGKSEFGHDIKLLDEAGNEVPDGEEGEVCFENKYVRGYINNPEETAKAFRDGLYHTGDLAKKDENGEIIICGRLNDMCKINGNRVEPAEIENITKKVLGIDWAAARIFDNGNRVFICAYYLDKNLNVNFEKTRREMEKYLPYYMLPSYFIQIDEVPLRPNGKMDRKALPAPQLDEYRSDYVAPRDDIEKALCEAFEKALKVSQIGINDDFYQLGGDSMTSMQVLVESNLQGLAATDIFRGHTPAKIAELYKENHNDSDGVSDAEKNAEAMKKPHTLTAEQLYMVDYQLYTPMSTMYNLFQMLKFDASMLNMDELAGAVNKAVKAHPALLTSFFFNEDGEMQQKYSPELFKEVTVEKLTEKELDELKDNLVKPFKIVNSCLFRCRLFETEEAGYLFLDVHHTIFDGTSSKVFFSDVLSAYAGQELETDNYYCILARREEQMNSKLYGESKEYFESTYSGTDWYTKPTTDKETRENEAEEIFQMLPTTAAGLQEVEDKYKLTPNMFYISTALLATSIYNTKKNIMLSWIYNGRNNMAEMGSVGLLFRNLPVAMKFEQDMTLKELYESVLNQVNKGIEHSCYPYVELGASAVTDDLECVLYQDNLREMEEVPGLEGTVEIRQNEAASQNILDLEILNQEEGSVLMLDYAAARYNHESIEKFGKIFHATAQTLLECNDKDDITIAKLIRKINWKTGNGGFWHKAWHLKWLKRV